MVRIEITVERHDPPSGRVVVPDDQRAPAVFNGWMDLIGALSELIGPPRNVEDQFGARPHAKLGEDV